MRTLLAALLGALLATPLSAQEPATVYEGVLAEENAPSAQVSTADLIAILSEGSALVLDARPHAEWAVSHIPGARNVAPKPGMPMSQYTSDVAEIERITEGDRARALVLYCNGPFCGKSKRLTADLVAAGFTQVRRYQLGIPVWRALGGVTVIEPDGARYVAAHDRTAVWIDVRETDAFAGGTVPGGRNIPRSRVVEEKDAGEVRAAKDDGRLPMEDHNTRIIVFGADGAQARFVAEALAREAFHNVAYFEEGYEALAAALAEPE